MLIYEEIFRYDERERDSFKRNDKAAAALSYETKSTTNMKKERSKMNEIFE